MMPEQRNTFNPSAKKRRILVVEDEFINQEVLKALISDTYEVIQAFTGTEALEIVSAQYETISLILLDLNLPDIHGLDVLHRMKEDPLLNRLPVIVMTADSEAEVESLTLGAIDFIPKPYPQQKVILARVLRTIELSEDRDILRWTERDHLTGLYNIEFFYRYAAQLDAYHKDAPTDAIMLNINHFRTINDRFGKSYGDEVLRQVAERVRGAVRETGGIVCRGEADTFLIYCPHREDYDVILDSTSIIMPGDGQHENRLRIRMGVYADVDKTLDIERRFDRAKMAADTVRGNFADAIGLYDSTMREAELLSEQLIEDFPTAIREKQFQVFYQPKFDVRPNDPVLCSAEALVRWKHPGLGMISPGVFIPLFEKNGLIQKLDRFVWSDAAAHVRAWKERLGISLPVSVNVSRVDLLDPSLVDKLQSIVSENGLSSSELRLEITESAYTENAEQIIEKVNQLRQIGFRIEMDDFGSGYSSLGMLSSLPIDALKLDMQFIRNAFKQKKDTRLLEVMIQLAENFEVPTIAEGVETEEQMLTLKMMGCDIVQGYYFSRPLPANEFEVFIVDNWKPMHQTDSDRKPQQDHDRFSYDSLHDAVTGFYNSNAFDLLFHGNEHKQIAVLAAEIDNYSALRQENGQEYVDHMVRRVADVLRGNFRSMDQICRLREDKFVIIMTSLGSKGRNLVTTKIDHINFELWENPDGLAPISLSVGVAFSDRNKPEEDIFQDAETALERMKEIRTAGYALC